MAVWLFDGAAVLMVLCAIAAIVQRNPLHTALLLGVVFAGLAVPFVLCGAEMLAALQVIIYAGAIIVLFVIAITMLGSENREAVEEQLNVRPVGTICAMAMGILLAALLAGPAVWALGQQRAGAMPLLLGHNVQAFGSALFTSRYIVPIEVASLILLAAMVAVVVSIMRAPAGAENDGDDDEQND